jgi:Flp pilus assembly protein TadG
MMENQIMRDTNVRPGGSGMGRRILELVQRRYKARLEDSGQALIMVLIAVLLIAVLVPIIGENVSTETVQVSRDTLSDLALAAAQAGANDYRTYIDNNSQYTGYTCGSPKGNLALGAGSSGGYACNTWEPVSGTTNEWFHYVPDQTQVKNSAGQGGSPGQLLLEVTGRAGYAGDYQYRSIIVGFTLSGILTDSYYSEYELADPNQPGVYRTLASVTLAGVTKQYPLSAVSVSYAEDNGGTYSYYGPESLLAALCIYHTYNENTFIDSLGTVQNKWVGSGTADASPTNPYYGPFYDNSIGVTYNVPLTLPNGNAPPNAGATITVPAGGICGAYGQGIYPSSVTFNGIAYTNDQLALCGNPTFNTALASGAPSNVPYGDDWPGSQARIVGGTTEYFPKGYTYDFVGGCSSSSQPTWGASASPKSPILNQDQHLPPTSSGFLPYADGTLQSSTGGNGCLFTGPTMIEFVKGGTMNVWSPLTQETDPNNLADVNQCGTYTPGQPWQTGITVPTGSVIYVEAEQSTGPNSGYDTAATAPKIINTPCSSFTAAMAAADEVDINVCVPGSGTYTSAGQALQGQVAATSTNAAIPQTSCIDPYLYNTLSGGGNTLTPSPTSLTTCEEGDAIVEGEFTGAVTIAADNNVVVSRDLTYQCADGAGAASDLNPSSVAACNAAGSNDVLALVPTDELVVAGPTNQPFNNNCGVGASPNCGGRATTTCPDDGTEANPNVTNVVPWSCDINNTYADGTTGVVIDAAAVDLTGSTAAQNFDIIGLGNANLYQNGTNINYYPGFNGSPTPTGYNQIITYDSRLSYENPPGLLQATDTVWNMTSFILCGTVNSANNPTLYPGGPSAAQTLSCPPLN